MKRILIALVAASAVFASSSAFAATPQCSSGQSKGTKCLLNGGMHYSCGDGSFVKTSHGLNSCEGGARVDQNGNLLKKTSKQERTRR